MAEDIAHVNAVQEKNRIDLITENAKETDTFIEKKLALTDKYGATTANLIMKDEEAAMVEKQNKRHKGLEERNLKQWDNYHAGKPIDTPEEQPKKIEITVIKEKNQDDDKEERRRKLIEAYKKSQEDMKLRKRTDGRTE